MCYIIKLSLGLVILVMTSKMSDAARILGLFPVPSRNHFAPCEVLMKGLAARGHQVDVVSAFPLDNSPANYRDISIANYLPVTTNNLTFEDTKHFNILNFKNLIDMAGTSLCHLIDVPELRSIIKNPPTNPPYDLVIHELFMTDCFLAFGRHLKVPVVTVIAARLYDWSIGPLGNPSSTAFVPSVYSEFDQRMNFFERLQNTLQSFYLKAVYGWTVKSQLKIVKNYFGIELSSMSELYNDIALLLVNTHRSFDFVRPMNPAIVEVGGLHQADRDHDFSPETKKWLDGSKDGCVYFSFGPMLKIESFPVETIKTFYGAFERIAPVRVLMKIADTTDLPVGLPKNVITAPWLPQDKVLQHKNVKAFATNCEIMSTQDSVTYGVPIIAIPVFSDQFLNARLSEQHGVGVVVDHRIVTADSLANDIKAVLQNSSYSENVKRLSKLFMDRPASALDTATFWVEHVLRNGNVLRSPAADMSWWQLECLDVYGFVIAIFLLMTYAIKQLVIFLCSLAGARCVSQQQSKPIGNVASKLKKIK